MNQESEAAPIQQMPAAVKQRRKEKHKYGADRLRKPEVQESRKGGGKRESRQQRADASQQKQSAYKAPACFSVKEQAKQKSGGERKKSGDPDNLPGWSGSAAIQRLKNKNMQNKQQNNPRKRSQTQAFRMLQQKTGRSVSLLYPCCISVIQQKNKQGTNG